MLDFTTYERRPTNMRLCNLEALNENFMSFTEVLGENCDVNQYYNSFSLRLSTSAVANRQRKSKQWFDKECYSVHEETKTARNLFLNTGSDTDYLSYAHARRRYKYICRNKKLSFFNRRENKILSRAENDKKSYWDILKMKNRRPAKCHVQPTQWESHFQNLLCTNEPILEPNFSTISCFHDYMQTLSRPISEIDNPITQAEITLAISTAPNGKAAGPDQITNELLKQSYGVTYPFLLALFNHCFQHTCFPKKWRTAYLLPIYKNKGAKDDPNNYRGISMFSCVFKCFPNIIYCRLLD